MFGFLQGLCHSRDTRRSIFSWNSIFSPLFLSADGGGFFVLMAGRATGQTGALLCPVPSVQRDQSRPSPSSNGEAMDQLLRIQHLLPITLRQAQALGWGCSARSCPSSSAQWDFRKPQPYPKADVTSSGFSFPFPSQEPSRNARKQPGLPLYFQRQLLLLVTDFWISEIRSNKDEGHCVSLRLQQNPYARVQNPYTRFLTQEPDWALLTSYWRIHGQFSIYFRMIWSPIPHLSIQKSDRTQTDS